MIALMFGALAVLGITAVLGLAAFARAYLRDPGPGGRARPFREPVPEVHHDEYAPVQRWHPDDWETYERAEAEAWHAEVVSVFPPWEPFANWLSDAWVGALQAVR